MYNFTFNVLCLCDDRAEKLYEEYNQFRAVIKYDGRVHWEPAGRKIYFIFVWPVVFPVNSAFRNISTPDPKTLLTFSRHFNCLNAELVIATLRCKSLTKFCSEMCYWATVEVWGQLPPPAPT